MKYDKYSSNGDHMYRFFSIFVKFDYFDCTALANQQKQAENGVYFFTVSSVLDKLFVIIKTVYFEFSAMNFHS